MLGLFAAVRIPDLNIAALAVVALSGILGPTLLFLIFRKKYSLSLPAFAVGAGAYMVVVLLIENPLIHLTSGEDSVFHEALISNPALNMFYIGFLSGLLEEGGCYLVFLLMKKRYQSFSAPLSIALGYSAIESIVLVGVSYAVYCWLAISNNSLITSGISADSSYYSGFYDLYLTLSSESPLRYFAAGLECMMFIGIHIGLFSLVWYSVARPGSTYLLYASILLHAVFKAPEVLKDIRVIEGEWFYLIILFFIMLFSLMIAFFVRRADMNSRNKSSDPFSVF